MRWSYILVLVTMIALKLFITTLVCRKQTFETYQRLIRKQCASIFFATAACKGEKRSM